MTKRHKYKKGELEPLGGFTAIPFDLFSSKGFKALSVEARALLLEVIGQYRGDNNGDLTPSIYVVGESLKWGKTRHAKAVAELRESRLIQITRYGKAGSSGITELWALSWLPLDYDRKMDIAPKDFKRFLYRDLPTINPNAKQDERALRLVEVSLKAASRKP